MVETAPKTGHAHLAEVEERIHKAGAMQDEANAMNAAFDIQKSHEQALAMDHQFDVDKAHQQALDIEAERLMYEQALAMDTTWAAGKKKEWVEARELSPEVSELNDQAELRLFGTRGGYHGFVNPATREPLTTPILGKVDLMREDKRYGKGKIERDEAADKYEADINELVGEGFQLCQAEVIMNMREIHAQQLESQRTAQNDNYTRKLNVLVNNYVKNQDTSHTEAIKLAKRRLKAQNITPFKQPTKAESARLDKALKQYIRENGVMTTAEFVDPIDPLAPTPQKTDDHEAESHEAYKFPNQTPVRYNPYGPGGKDKFPEGHVRLGYAVVEDGAELDFDKHPDTNHAHRMMVITDEHGNEYLVLGHTVDDASQIKANNSRIGARASLKDGKAPKLTIGKQWTYYDVDGNPFTTAGKVASVEIAHGDPVDADAAEKSGHGQLDRDDPFQRLMDELSEAVRKGQGGGTKQRFRDNPWAWAGARFTTRNEGRTPEQIRRRRIAFGIGGFLVGAVATHYLLPDILGNSHEHARHGADAANSMGGGHGVAGNHGGHGSAGAGDILRQKAVAAEHAQQHAAAAADHAKQVAKEQVAVEHAREAARHAKDAAKHAHDHAGAATHHLHQAGNAELSFSGDTVWNESARTLHAHGVNNPQAVNWLSNATVHRNGISPEHLHQMAIGEHFTIDDDDVKEAIKRFGR